MRCQPTDPLLCRDTSCFRTKANTRSRFVFAMGYGYWLLAEQFGANRLRVINSSKAQTLRAAAVRLLVDTSMSSIRTFRLPKRISVLAAQGCGNAQTIRLSHVNAVDGAENRHSSGMHCERVRHCESARHAMHPIA